MGQVLGLDRNGGLTKISSNVVQMNLSTLGDIKVTLGGQQYQATSVLQINTSTVGAGGLDTGSLGVIKVWYVHYVLNGSTVSMVASLSKTAPTGFSVFLWTGYVLVSNDSSQVGFVANSTTWEMQQFTMVVSATVTNPTKGTAVQDNAQWRRVGPNMEISWDYGQNGSGTNGSGVTLYGLPGTFAIDTSKQGVTGSTVQAICGYGSFAQPYTATPTSNALNRQVPLVVIPYDSTHLSFLCQDVQSTAGFVLLGYDKILQNNSTTNFSTGNAGWTWRASVPIAGWSANVL